MIAKIVDLFFQGGKVVMLCRNVSKAEDAASAIRQETGGLVTVWPLDLGSLDSVRQCANQILQEEDRIDILINNAGNNRDILFEISFSTLLLDSSSTKQIKTCLFLLFFQAYVCVQSQRLLTVSRPTSE